MALEVVGSTPIAHPKQQMYAVYSLPLTGRHFFGIGVVWCYPFLHTSRVEAVQADSSALGHIRRKGVFPHTPTGEVVRGDSYGRGLCGVKGIFAYFDSGGCAEEFAIWNIGTNPTRRVGFEFYCNLLYLSL